jgi:basic membrane protein A
MDYDWCGNLANGAVEYFGVNEKIAATGTKKAMDDAAASIKNGTLNVFDTNTFTVSRLDIKSGDTTYNVSANISRNADNKITSYKAGVDTFGGDTQVVEGGVFKESVYRSAPYFDLRIDGITEL